MKKTHCGNHQPNGLQFLILALFFVLIGSSTAAYGQDFFTSFETAPNFGTFTLFPSPNSVTFTGGFTQSQGITSLYKSGDKSFMVNPGNTGTITFQTPAASVTLWLRDRFSGNPSVLTVRDQNNQVMSTFNATTSFVQVNIVPEGGKLVGSMTLRNNGSGMAVIDDFGFTAVQTVTFDDPNLENAVRNALGIGPTDPLTLVAVQTLTSLSSINANIQSLGGIESLSNLTFLDLGSNSISDLTPLAGLIQLTRLFLENNPISDITALVSNPGLGAGDVIDLTGTALGLDDCPDLQALEGRGALVFDDAGCELVGLTFNPTAQVTLGGSQPGSVIAADTTPQIVRTMTFPFNSRDDLPSSRTMTFDTGVLNINTLALDTRLFETNLVISTAILGPVATARVGHTVVSLNPDSATLVGTVEATTIDPGVASLLPGVTEIIQALIGSVGINSSFSASSGGFSYTDSFNVPDDIVPEDIQSFQIEVVVTDAFPVDLYSTTPLDGALTVSNDLTSVNGLTSGPILDPFIVSGAPESGTERWVLLTGGSVNSSPAIDTEGTVYVGSADGNLYATNPDGTMKWTFQTDGGVNSSPAIGPEGTVYVGSLDGRLYAINPDGMQKWFFPTVGGVESSPAIGKDGTVYVGSADGNLYAINPDDGTQKWAFMTSGGVNSSPAIDKDGTVYVGSLDGSVYAINPDGTQKWFFPTVGGVESSPAIGKDGTVYVGSADGNLYAINPDDGTQKWALPTGVVVSSPAIGPDGALYVGSLDGNLYAINGSSGGLSKTPWPMFHHDLKHTGRRDPARIGVFRNGSWFLDFNGDNQFTDCTTDRCIGFGVLEDLPVTGDWNGSGTTKIGVFRNGSWFLDFNGDNQFSDCTTDRCIGFGLPEDLPVTGDWNGSGTTKIGVVRDGVWFLDFNGDDQFSDCTTDRCIAFGLPGDLPVTGDWNGSGTTKMGVVRDGVWFLDFNGDDQFSDCTTDRCIGFGLAGDVPVTGQW